MPTAREIGIKTHCHGAIGEMASFVSPLSVGWRENEASERKRERYIEAAAFTARIARACVHSSALCCDLFIYAGGVGFLGEESCDMRHADGGLLFVFICMVT